MTYLESVKLDFSLKRAYHYTKVAAKQQENTPLFPVVLFVCSGTVYKVA